MRLHEIGAVHISRGRLVSLQSLRCGHWLVIFGGLIFSVVGCLWLSSWGIGGDWAPLSEAGLLLVWSAGHCDGLDGPVVTQAKQALKEENVNLVLPWVAVDQEAEVRDAFRDALAVRKLGPEAEHIADRHFFETLVRVHRAGEGAAYTGLKPAGRDLGPAIPAADRAVQRGAISEVENLLADALRTGLYERLQAVLSRKSFAVDDVVASRDYVKAYVTFIHYVEGAWQSVTSGGHGHHGEQDTHKH